MGRKINKSVGECVVSHNRTAGRATGALTQHRGRVARTRPKLIFQLLLLLKTAGYTASIDIKAAIEMTTKYKKFTS